MVSSDHMEAAKTLLSMGADMPCTYCRRPMSGTVVANAPAGTAPTRDHIWPKEFRSATHGREGKVWCCNRCNLVKGNMMPAEWLKFMSDNPEWWLNAKPYNRRPHLAQTVRETVRNARS